MSEIQWDEAWQTLRFDNRFTRELPADPETRNETRQVYKACYSRVSPRAVSQPQLIAYSPEIAEQLGFARELIASPQFAEVFGGNGVHPKMDPFAMCYGGHQFGQWAGQLGDGRAINLCELIDRDGNHQTLQLKGAGPTPYSRHADGLAVLRSSLREFLCSEAMHHLGVPTTRALSLVLTGDLVVRDMFYDGNPKKELGAIVCRVAPSFLRLGSFQIFAQRKDVDTLRTLADYSIRNDFPQLGDPGKDVYPEWFAEICRRTATLMVHWMRVGFVHGVMNTDNLSVLGQTIDYGPYGWLEDYDPNWTPNTTDASGRRYRYGHQPQIAQWNLAQFGSALLPLVDDQVEPLQAGLREYVATFETQWQSMMIAKLGLDRFRGEDDERLLEDLLQLLQRVETDMTLFYRRLATIPCDEDVDSVCERLADAYYEPEQVDDAVRSETDSWFQRYRKRVNDAGIPDARRRATMDAVNPLYVLRNYLAQLAIDRCEQGDPSGISELQDVLRNPYQSQDGKHSFAEKRPDWAKHRAGCSMLSCSS